MKEKNYFDIACFHFILKEKESMENVGKYLLRLKELLTTSSNITNVDIKLINKKRRKELVNRIKIGNSIVKHFSDFSYILQNCEICFELHIPFEEQVKIIPPLMRYKDRIEYFKIRIYFLDVMPVVFIGPIKADSDYPLHSVSTIVQGFLKKLFSESNNEDFQFIINGTLNYDIYIEPNYLNDSANATWIHIFNKEEKIINFIYDKNHYSNEENAHDEILQEITIDISRYLDVSEIISYRHSKWEEIEKNIIRIKEFQKRNIFLSAYGKLFSLPAIISQLFLQLIEFKSEEIIFSNYIDAMMGGYYQFSNKKIFESKILENRDRFSNRKYPYKEVFELINFYESRSINTIIIVAGIIGVVLGAILTKIFA